MRLLELSITVSCLAFCCAASAVSLRAQQSNSSSGPPSAPAGLTAQAPPVHRFWDRDNAWLFAGVGAARALDDSSTLNMRRRGRQEILLSNWVVDNHPLFAGVEVGGAALSIGVSYLFHRTGHHTLERWVSVAHISLATAGDIRNYSLQTAHPAPVSH